MSNVMVGIDPSFRHTGLTAAIPTRLGHGYRVIDTATIHTDAVGAKAKKQKMYVADADVMCCDHLLDEFDQFLAKHNPAGVVIELPTAGAKGARANRCMGIATALVVAVVRYHKLPRLYISPDDVKRLVLGLPIGVKLKKKDKKPVDKDQVMDYVAQRFGTYAWPEAKKNFEHAADAMCALLVAKTSHLYRDILATIDE